LTNYNSNYPPFICSLFFIADFLIDPQTDKYILPFLWEPWILFGWARYPLGIKVSQVTLGHGPVFVPVSVVHLFV
jgi:hypothetical protein